IYGPVISAAQSAARQQARLPRTDENGLGARDAVPPTQEGTQAPRRPPAVQAPESLTSERFPRRVRLARGSDLTACWDQGRRWRTPHLDVAWRPNRVGHPRTGVIVPRFQFSAVARNRLRRRVDRKSTRLNSSHEW